MSRDHAARAALNNARWSDAVCRAHGRPGEFRPALWLNRQVAPPFYSNVVTLTPDNHAAQLAAIDELSATRSAFSVKDSFATLDLRARGFDILFEATWLWRQATVPAPDAQALSWAAVMDETGLARWETVWKGLGDGQAVAAAERVFPPALLAEPGVVLLTGLRDGRIVAVAALNLTGDVAGVSNVYSAAEDADLCWAGTVAFAAQRFPGLPLAGYERGDDRERALRVGFQAAGPLRVWAR